MEGLFVVKVLSKDVRSGFVEKYDEDSIECYYLCVNFVNLHF